MDDLGIAPKEAGIWVWEGTFRWTPGSWECPQDGEYWPEGKFRLPNEDEWQAIREGRCPWDPDDWLLPEYREVVDGTG